MPRLSRVSQRGKSTYTKENLLGIDFIPVVFVCLNNHLKKGRPVIRVFHREGRACYFVVWRIVSVDVITVGMVWVRVNIVVSKNATLSR